MYNTGLNSFSKANLKSYERMFAVTKQMASILDRQFLKIIVELE